MTPDPLKLLAVALVVAGFLARLNTLLVVVLAGLVTTLAAGLTLHEGVTLLGQLFVENRFMVAPMVLMVPIVGLLERAGLREYVAAAMRRTRASSAGRVLWLYQLARGVTSMFGLNLGNHASMVRPLVSPLAEGAAETRGTPLEPDEIERVRAHAAAAENVGNFFSDDLVVAVGALLLIQGVFTSAGVRVELASLKLWSAPTALWVLAVGFVRYRRLDRTLDRKGRSDGAPP